MFHTKLLVRCHWFKQIATILLVLLLVVIGLIIYFEYQDYLLEDYLLKIVLIVLGIAIAMVDIGGFLDDNKKLRKKTLYALFGSLLLLTVLDTTNESVNDRKAQNERDRLIRVDSLRFDRIVRDFDTNIHKLDSIRGQVILAFDEVLSVKKDVGEQRPILGTILSNTSGTFQETKSLIEGNSPDIRFDGKRSKAYFDHEGNLKLELFPGNLGLGVAKNVHVFYQVFFATFEENTTNIYYRFVGPRENPSATYSKGWTKLEVDYLTPSMGSAKNIIRLSPNLSKDNFSSNGSQWFVVFSTKCEDYRDKTILKTLTLHGKLNKDGVFDLTYNRIKLESIKSNLEAAYGMGKYIIIEN